MKTIEDFHLDMIRRIDKFSDFWIKNQELTPDDYPCEMQDADWDEQFLHRMSITNE